MICPSSIIAITNWIAFIYDVRSNHIDLIGFQSIFCLFTSHKHFFNF